MKSFLFRLSRLLSFLGFLIIIVSWVFPIYFFIDNGFKLPIWDKFIPYIFSTTLIPPTVILLFNWLCFGKISIWIKNPNTENEE
jgi:hypothetical protein